MNPTFTNVSDIDKLAEGTEDVDWTHWDDARDVYGVDEEGWARAFTEAGLTVKGLVRPAMPDGLLILAQKAA